MSRRILALAQELHVSKEALQYACSLAHRVESHLVLLLLLSRDLLDSRGEEWLRQRGEALLRRRFKGVGLQAASVRQYVKIGDPWSELCKFAALQGPFQLVVWVSDKEGQDGRSARPAGNWINRVREGLGCPVVVAQRRH